jgi:CRISPR-associated protein Cmr3
MSTPGIFPQGWLPERVVDGTLMGEGFSARLVAASISRYEIISGWDIARWSPKPALRTVPVGSVYWFDQLDGDVGKLAEWVSGGLWSDTSDSQRRAEGFNQAMLAAWPKRN